jgi:hypothetical protein
MIKIEDVSYEDAITFMSFEELHRRFYVKLFPKTM